MHMRFKVAVGIALFACFFAIGCSGKTNRVSGKVTLDGKPLGDGGVTLVSVDPNDVGIHSGTTNASGDFSIRGNQGALIKPGTYIVVVDKAPEEIGDESIVPDIYRDQKTSPLRITVSGDSTVIPEIQLATAQ